MATCTSKFRLRRNTTTDEVEIVKVQLDASGNALVPAHLYYSNGDILDETGAVVASPEYADFATALSAATTCAHVASTNDIEVLEDASGVAYSGIFDPVTGTLTGAIGFDGTAYTGDLSLLTEIGDRDVEYGGLSLYCIDGIEWKSQVISIFEADHADGSTPLSTTTIWSTAQVGSETATDPRQATAGGSAGAGVNTGDTATDIATSIDTALGLTGTTVVFNAPTDGFTITLPVDIGLTDLTETGLPTTYTVNGNVIEITGTSVIKHDGSVITTVTSETFDFVYSGVTPTVTFGACEAAVIPDPVVDWIDGCDCVAGGAVQSKIVWDFTTSPLTVFDASGVFDPNDSTSTSSDFNLILAFSGPNDSHTFEYLVTGETVAQYVSDLNSWLSAGSVSSVNLSENYFELLFTSDAKSPSGDSIEAATLTGSATDDDGILSLGGNEFSAGSLPDSGGGETVCTEVAKRLVYKFDAACVLSSTPSQVDFFLPDRETPHTLAGAFGDCPELAPSEWSDGAC